MKGYRDKTSAETNSNMSNETSAETSVMMSRITSVQIN